MNVDNLTDLYCDYLLASTGLATSTGLSAVLDGEINHDKITRFLASRQLDSQWVWQQAKSIVRELIASQYPAVLAIDDSISETPYSSENELVCWHYDHSKGQAQKAINFGSAVLNTKEASLPVAMELVRKDRWVEDPKTGPRNVEVA